MGQVLITINHTNFLFWVLSALLLSFSTLAAMPLPGQNPERPNIVLISIDDLRPDIGSYGHPVAKTPNLDDFAQTAMLFERAYTQQAQCGPSRAALMTGLRPSTSGITRLDQPVSKVIPSVVTLNKLLKNHGYETVSIGKIYHHLNDDLAGWSKIPFDANYDMSQINGGKWLSSANVKSLAQSVRDRKKGALPNPAYDVWQSKQLLPDELNLKYANSELERLSGQKKPFFLAFGLHRPHLPFRVPKSDWDKYDPKQVPSPKNAKQQLGAPDWAVVAWEIWNYDNLPPRPGPMPPSEAEKLRHGYLASVSFADGIVGKILKKMSALGLDKNTIVVIWGDHGFKLGDHGGWAKHSNVELDIHIPLIIRVPGMSAPLRTDALVETVDIYPTLIDIAGLDQPHKLEGVSLVPLISEPNRVWKEAVFAQYPRYVKKQLLMGETVRTDDYRYTAWVANDGEVRAEELYDHKIDPIESVNIASDSDYIVQLERHKRLRSEGWGRVHNSLKQSTSAK